jgi:cytochrome c556
MKRFACLFGVVALVIAAPLLCGSAGAGDEASSIKDIMGALHKGAKSPLIQLKGQLKSDSPDWAAVQGGAKQFVSLGSSLGKFDPPKGDAQGYKSLAANYYANAKALDKAAQGKDLAAAKAAFGKLSASCKDCHSQHKGQ